MSPRTSIDTRVRSQIASAVSLALGLPAPRVRTLTLQEIFVLCQQHGFEVSMTAEKPATFEGDEIGFSAELDVAA